MQGSLEADDVFFENSPIIIKDKYAVSGSDMAQIGWVEVTTENGANRIPMVFEVRARNSTYVLMTT